MATQRRAPGAGSDTGPAPAGGERVPPTRLLVIVPALNEEASVAAVVADARRVLGADVLVVDDGSTDATAAVAAGAGAFVVSHPFNLGVGAAIRSAMRYAFRRQYDIVLQVDGDGQHDVGEGAKLVDVVASGQADVAIGSRFDAGYRVSRGRRMTMRALSRIISARVGAPITDTTSGFRAFNRHAIDVFARSYPTDYLSDTVEALLLAKDAHLTLLEVPVKMYERQAGKASTNIVTSAFYFVRLLLIISLHSLRPPLVTPVDRSATAPR